MRCFCSDTFDTSEEEVFGFLVDLGEGDSSTSNGAVSMIVKGLASPAKDQQISGFVYTPKKYILNMNTYMAAIHPDRMVSHQSPLSISIRRSRGR